MFTAIPIEFEQIANRIRPHRTEKSTTGTRFSVGTVVGDGVEWEVFVTEIGAGNAGAAAEVAAAVERYRPELVLFVGIAGGLKPDNQVLGDVVVADRVYNVHSGKYAVGDDGESSRLGRPVALPASHRLTQLAREVGRSDWQTDFGDDGRPASVHLKPIAAAEALLADEQSELRERIASTYNDAAAVDMESFGVFEASRRAEVPALVIRGLSDFAGAAKQPAADHVRQPYAASTAADFAIALLRHADPDDLPIGRGATDQPPSGTGTDDRLAVLPPTVRPWWRRLFGQAPQAAQDALTDLASHASSPTGWLGRVRYRPPRWLREDVTGDAWAVIGAFAEAHQAPLAVIAYERAAEIADQAGDDIAATIHRLTAAMALVHTPQKPGDTSEATTGDAASPGAEQARRRLLTEQDDIATVLAAFFAAAIANDREATFATAPDALAALGLDVATVLPGHPVDALDEATPAQAAFAEIEAHSPGTLDRLRVHALSILTLASMVDDDTARAVAICEYAREVVPEASGMLLLEARAHLQAVAGPGASRASRPTTETAAILADIEQTALLVRDRRREWHGATGEALAVAGRARAQRGDFSGALYLLLPAPKGRASDEEAKHPEVRETAALAAAMAGDAPLALELSDSIRDPVDRHLLRALALVREPSMHGEALDSYRAALDLVPNDRPDQLTQALIGIVGVGASLDPDVPGSVASDLERLRTFDSEAADLVEVNAHITAGRHREALVLARRYPRSTAAVQFAADAAVMSGNAAEAVLILERRGRESEDDALLLQAMGLAVDASLDADADRLSTLLLSRDDHSVRLAALRARIELAARRSDWHDVAVMCRTALTELAANPAPGHELVRAVSIRWALVTAEFNRRRFDAAAEALEQPEPISPRNRGEALLCLAVLRAAEAVVEPATAIAKALSVATDWIDDEEVVASAIALVLTTAPNAPVPDPLLIEVRRLQEEYFARHGENASIRRIHVDEDDLSELVEFLKTTFAPSAAQRDELARRVWHGELPRAILADAAHRSYAELLVKRVPGCVVIAGDEHEPRRQRAAHAALTTGSVVIDTSAIHVLMHLGLRPERVVAEFSHVSLPASLRDDALTARGNLAMGGSGSLGWDSTQNRPVISEFTEAETREWAKDAEALATLATSLHVVPDARDSERHFDRAMLLARELGCPVWVDDLALTYAAESIGVPAFGTLDLLHVLAQEGKITPNELAEATRALIGYRAVDLPIVDQLVDLAQDDGWKPGGPASLLLARPRTWSHSSTAFERYRELILSVPSELVSVTPTWAEAAATGLALSCPPAGRSGAVAALLAWTLLNTDRAQLPAFVGVAERVQAETAPDSDMFGDLVDVLADVIGDIAGPSQSGAIVAQLIAPLDDERRTSAMRRFLTRRPPAPSTATTPMKRAPGPDL